MMNKIDFKELGDKVEVNFPLAIHAPFDPEVDYYLNSNVAGLGKGYAVPMEYTDWRDEVMSWKKGCYIHAGLNDAPTFRVKGPDAVKFFSDVSVNSFTKFPVGGIKHCIMCNKDGLIMTHGILLRSAEDEFESFFLAPYAAYKFYTGNYNAKDEWIQDQVIYQVAGPKSLETLEVTTGECLHDIQFARHRMSKIAGADVRICRVGMAGSLAYEVHAKKNIAREVYNAIFKAGEHFGIKKLGFYAYQLSHTEDGFPQGFMHFPYPWGEDRGMMDFLKMPGFTSPVRGSMGQDMRLRYRNPVELGWAKTIKFDHDFIGREALEKEAANPCRAMVTLEWNTEDILDVHMSQYQIGEHYMPMTPSHFGQMHGKGMLVADQVLKDGKMIGISSGRNYSYYYRKMISLCSIDIGFSKSGTEVTVLWGDPGTRQKEIRATVARFPYLNENRNENIDVSTIPCQIHK
jgi:glycine cleavage system aminomethyltransferase T